LALAAALAAVVIIDRRALAPPPAAGGRYVAIVDAGGHQPALIAEVDTASGLIRIRTLEAAAPAGRSLELWHVPQGKPPRSLGLLKAGADLQTIKDALAEGPVGGLIAVSVEPEGGSPSGAPTGPVIYSGQLVPVE
jgi:anti-sigma-K factor RskA